MKGTQTLGELEGSQTSGEFKGTQISEKLTYPPAQNPEQTDREITNSLRPGYQSKHSRGEHIPGYGSVESAKSPQLAIPKQTSHPSYEHTEFEDNQIEHVGRMDCPVCNILNRDDARFCKSCGQPLSLQQAPASQEDSDDHLSNAPVAVQEEASTSTVQQMNKEQKQEHLLVEEAGNIDQEPTLILTPEKMIAYKSKRWQQQLEQTTVEPAKEINTTIEAEVEDLGDIGEYYVARSIRKAAQSSYSGDVNSAIDKTATSSGKQEQASQILQPSKIADDVFANVEEIKNIHPVSQSDTPPKQRVHQPSYFWTPTGVTARTPTGVTAKTSTGVTIKPISPVQTRHVHIPPSKKPTRYNTSNSLIAKIEQSIGWTLVGVFFISLILIFFG